MYKVVGYVKNGRVVPIRAPLTPKAGYAVPVPVEKKATISTDATPHTTQKKK